MKINVSDEQLALLAQTGDKKAVEILMHKYKSFVSLKCKKYYMIGATNDDIVQEGMIGLYRAIMGFKYDKNDSFKAFASICIKRRIISALKTANKQKNIPLNTSVSLEKPVEGNNVTLGEMIEQKGLDPEEIFIHREKQKSVFGRLDGTLSCFEKKVLAEYVKNKSYDEIAKRLGISKKSVDNALQRIKHKTDRIN